MSPIPQSMAKDVAQNVGATDGSDPKPKQQNELILEAWAQGYMVGSLIIMAFITLANMRRGVLLHKVSESRWLFPSTAADLILPS